MTNLESQDFASRSACLSRRSLGEGIGTACQCGSHHPAGRLAGRMAGRKNLAS